MLESGMSCSSTNVLLKRDSWYSFSASRVKNFSGLSGGGGGARELEPTLFRFSGTVFFRAMEE